MQALGDRVIVKPIKEEKTSGGIILTTPVETADAVVVSVGEKTPIVKEGDTIRYIPNSGVNFTKDDEDYKLLRITDILFIH